MRFIPVLAALLVACAAHAQNYPSRPIRIIVPYAPGGLPDTMTRLVGGKLADPLGQPIVVENMGGAGGINGVAEVVKSAPDGYTLLVADVGQIAINPHLFSKLPYQPLKDLAPVSLIGTSPLYLVAHPSVPANTLKELVALAKKEPGKLNYGSSGIGSIHHLATEALKAGFGIDIVHVPYKGTGQSVPALLGGQVALLYSALPSIAGHLKDGKVKMLAISSAKRSPHTPDVPTVAENGIAGYDFVAEIGLLAPAATPREVIQRLAGEMAKVAKQPDVVKRFTELGIDAVGSSPADYGALNKTEFEKYGRLVKETGAKVD
ncbi:MAG: tripartite tricarboxylate transporter substrate binding protein [Betaproteobacteria bacterium]|nr:tripartite tricarboxylate transporter substrate binding protein [Betaproteobacteria bacterium]